MKKIIPLYCVIILIFAGSHLSAQNFDDLSFGTDTTFEVLTWNIEWFPKNGLITLDYVTQIIEALDVDLLALQEISDTNLLKQMVDNLEGYEAYFKSAWYAGLAYLYKTGTIQINDIYEIYTTSPYWSPFPRSPMVVDLNFMGKNYIVINNHFKCCGDGILNLNDTGDEETRRYIASNLLKEYIDNYFPDKPVMVTGDLNDMLSDDPENNVFQLIINDTANYLFADFDIAMGSNTEWSYPTWPSHLDHILITNELFDEFDNTNSITQTIKPDEYLAGGWWEYENNVSDHRPVAIKFTPNTNSNVGHLYTSGSEFFNVPNPFIKKTIFFFDPILENAKIEIFNSTGKHVFTINLPKGVSSINWNAENLSNGIYNAVLVSGEKALASIKIFMIR